MKRNFNEKYLLLRNLLMFYRKWFKNQTKKSYLFDRLEIFLLRSLSRKEIKVQKFFQRFTLKHRIFIFYYKLYII